MNEIRKVRGCLKCLHVKGKSVDSLSENFLGDNREKLLVVWQHTHRLILEEQTFSYSDKMVLESQRKYKSQEDGQFYMFVKVFGQW